MFDDNFADDDMDGANDILLWQMTLVILDGVLLSFTSKDSCLFQEIESSVIELVDASFLAKSGRRLSSHMDATGQDLFRKAILQSIDILIIEGFLMADGADTWKVTEWGIEQRTQAKEETKKLMERVKGTSFQEDASAEPASRPKSATLH